MMYGQIAFTGPRNLTHNQRLRVWDIITTLSTPNWLVGDAEGLDSFIRESATTLEKNLTVYRVQGRQRWDYAARSKRMVDDLRGILYAFPNKECPEICYPGSKSWGGSGTWGTVAYARHTGKPVCVCPLQYGLGMPEWYICTGEVTPSEPKQLDLFNKS